MLNSEVFGLKSKEISKTADALGFVPVARSIAFLSDNEEVPIHWREKDRFYEIKRKGLLVEIEGLYVPNPNFNKNLSTRERLLQIVEMDSVKIGPDGIVISGGQRISPHDLRLAFLTEDLRMGEQIVAGLYKYWKDRSARG